MGKSLLRVILSVFVGGSVGFLLLLLGDAIHILVTCGIVAFLAADFTYSVVGTSSLRSLVSAAGGIAGFFLYFWIYNFANDNIGSILVGSFVFFGPYVVLVYLLSRMKDVAEPKDTDSQPLQQ